MTAQVVERTVPTIFPAANGLPKRISWAEFEKKYLCRADGFKYEWLNGIVSKTKKSMEKKQFYILNNLLRVLHKMIFAGKPLGQFVNEGDIFFLANHRKPDIAYLSLDQLARTARDINQVPEFIIEVISKNDQINPVEEKMLDYAAAGVKVVWQIFPLTERVKVYSGPELSESRTLRDDMICSAAPVLPEFKMTVQELFTKPEMPEG